MRTQFRRRIDAAFAIVCLGATLGLAASAQGQAQDEGSLSDDAATRSKPADAAAAEGPEALQALVKLAADPKEALDARESAVDAIFRIRIARMPKTMHEAMAQAYDPKSREAFGASRLEDSPAETFTALLPHLKELLMGDDDAMRNQAAAWLAQGGKPGLEALLGLLWIETPLARPQSTEENLAAEPTIALMTLAQAAESTDRGAAALPILQDASKDKRDAVRARAAFVTAMMSSSPLDRSILPPLLRSDDPEAIFLALTAAIRDARSGDAALNEALLKLMDRPEPQIVITAMMLASASSEFSPAFAEAARKQLKNSNLDARATAALLLAQRGGPARAEYVPILAEALKAENAQLRKSAAETLSALGRDAAPAIPIMIEALEDPYYKVRRRAADGLGELGPLAKDAIPALRKAAESEASGIQHEATKALERISAEDGAMGLEELMRIAKSGKEGAAPAQQGYVRQEAIEQLARLGPDAQPAFDLLAEIALAEPRLAEASFAALSRIDPNPEKLLPVAREGMKDESGRRTIVEQVLPLLGPAGAEFVPALIEMLKRERSPRLQEPPNRGTQLSPDDVLRQQVEGERFSYAGPARALAAVTTDAAAQIGAPIAAELAAADEQGKLALLRAVYWIGPPAEAAAPEIQKELASENAEVRARAGIALASAAPAEAGPALPALADALNSESPTTRDRAAEALGRLGPMAEPAVPVLIAALIRGRIKASHQDGDIMNCVTRIDPENGTRRTAEAILEIIDAQPPKERLRMAGSLIRFGGEWRAKAVPALTSLLRDESLGRSSMTVYSYLRMAGPEASGAVPTLVEMLEEEIANPPKEGRGDSQALSLLAELGEAAAPAVPSAIKALESSSPELRRQAIQFVGQVGPPAAAAVPSLVKMLDGADPSDRTMIIGALGNTGSGAKEAIPAIERLLPEMHESEVLHAKQVLKQIRGE